MTRCIVFSAIGGTGKTTVARNLQKTSDITFKFSTSATTRQPRPHEKHGEDYYFLSVEEFKKNIEENNFIEYEEVFEDTYYGTLKKEVEKGTKKQPVILDIDVLGAKNVKKQYGDQALLIFLEPPSKKELKRRLKKRGDSEKSINQRLNRADLETEQKYYFDHIVVNDNLNETVKQIDNLITDFLQSS